MDAFAVSLNKMLLYFYASFIRSQEMNHILRVSPQAASVPVEIRMKIIYKRFYILIASFHLKAFPKCFDFFLKQ